jgi:uncharacterized repeat protein (TIGR03803 family)
MTKFKQVRAAYALLIVCAASATASASETFKTLVNFNGTNGAAPTTSLVQGLNGNLYGTTNGGGKYGGGTIFQVTPAGKLTTFYNFCAKTNCADGKSPQGALLLAADGNFYGTTDEGGANCVSSGGCGTVFKITPTGQLTTLYNFCAKGGTLCSDGQNPQAPLIEATDGNLYGTTFYGGNATDSGTFFKITTAGKLTTIHTFCSEGGTVCTDGAGPNGVVQDAEGNFLSTAYGGGIGDFSKFVGLIWEIIFKLSGILTPYDFCKDPNCADGARSQAPLAWYPSAFSGSADLYSQEAMPDGQTTSTQEFYGTTSGGGANLGGTVFNFSSTGTYKVVYSFCAKAKCADGAFPRSPVLEGTDGNLYGTTVGGDGNTKCPIQQGCGTVFQLTTAGALTTLHSFEIADGQYLNAGLVQATNGTFYGVTGLGGHSGDGTIFSVSMGLGPFVKTVPTAAKVGTTVLILGTDLTGASTVTFNGKTAKFKVVSATEITATVPTGATTGTVVVTTPSGTLKSWAFQVL